MATVSPISPISATTGGQPLDYDAEQRVLALMMQGRSNLAIVNHYKMQDLRLTLSQVQRVRELAGIEAVSPATKTISVTYPRGPRAEPEAGTSAGAQRRSEEAGDTKCDTVALPGQSFSIPPEFHREKSLVASSMAKRVSSVLVAPLRNRGWQGTFVALGIYLIAIYLCFLALAHVAVSAVHWMLAHKIISIMICGLIGWSWFLFVSKTPLHARLSEQAKHAMDSYGRHIVRALLILVRDAIEYIYHGGQQHREAEANRQEKENASAGRMRTRASEKVDLMAGDHKSSATPAKPPPGIARPQRRGTASAKGEAERNGYKVLSSSPMTSPREMVWT